MTPPTQIPEETIQAAIERGFGCERCGNCCKGDGAVVIGKTEAARMADFLGISAKAFLRDYAMRVAPGEWWLINKDNEENWCIFLEQDSNGLYGCSVNAAKPDQCRSFPAKWRNEDSFRSCAGLKKLMRDLEKSHQAELSAGRREATD